MATKRVYEIDGIEFASLAGFYDSVSTRLIPNAERGRSRDAFNDVLRGGFGTPLEGLVFRWKNSHVSQKRLGFSEKVRQLRMRLDKCHPTNRADVARELRLAEAPQGQTVFDWLTNIIRIHSPGGTEQEDGVEFELC